jgi:ADP-ribose pyrophosphatase YjhB (NUDIX family)
MSDMPPSPDISVALAKLIEEMSAIGQIGLTFGKDRFDLERYRRLRVLASEMMGLLSAQPPAQILDWLNLDQHYATPKLDVRGVVLRGDSILLVQERADGRWAPPGGWSDINQSAGETVMREVREESGLIVRAVRLIGLLDKQKHEHPHEAPHAFKSFFLCEEIGGALAHDPHETLAAAFHPLDDLPPLSLPRITAAQINALVKVARNPTLPALFD